jgi:hypothetical protein
MMFAAPADFEPGMWFRAHNGGVPLEWRGVEPIISRFPGKHRVRVLVGKGGVDFISDAATRFQVIDWRADR